MFSGTNEPTFTWLTPNSETIDSSVTEDAYTFSVPAWLDNTATSTITIDPALITDTIVITCKVNVADPAYEQTTSTTIDKRVIVAAESSDASINGAGAETTLSCVLFYGVSGTEPSTTLWTVSTGS